jgi:cysteine desulfurase
MRRAYLDHASTSPTRPDAVAALTDWFAGNGADPGRLHAEGMTSRVALETAREQLGALVGARPREVVLTSGATESIAAATWGARRRDPGRQRVVLSTVEHSAVRDWAARGPHGEVGVDRLGRIDADELLDAVDDTTALVHVQWANHEVGTLQPVREVVERCRALGVLVHVDAAQAVGHERVAFTDLGADLMSVSGHKFGAPPGTGALLVRRGLRLDPLLVGGDQERARRAGMENVPALVGMGAAAEALAASLDREADDQRRFTARVIDWASSAEGVRVLGDGDGRVAHLVCLGFDDVEPQPVLLGLDQAGVAVHSGSSCSTESLEPSPVLQAMGVDADRSLRISVGWSTTDTDVDRLLGALPEVLARLRALRR